MSISKNLLIDRIFEYKAKTLHDGKKKILLQTHPLYLSERVRIEERYGRELEQIDIMQKDGIDLIDATYSAEKDAIEKDYEQRIEELVDKLYNEYEEKKRQLESEINGLDIASTNSTPNNYYFGVQNKKTLRRRPNDVFDQPNEKRPRKGAIQNIVHLLPESAIAQDVRLMCGDSSLLSGTSASDICSASFCPDDEGTRPVKVQFENFKLNYGGKSFTRGQSVSLQTQNYGRFPAILQTIGDKFVQFKASMPGDTRQVTATRDDLECGRVVIRKRY